MTTETQFLKDVESHVIEVIKDDGLYRHIRLRKPGTMCMHFDLLTWPGYLCYTGDMGTYVFRRLEDMFEFFRSDREYAQRRGRQLSINTHYWAEKLEAVDGGRHRAGVLEFDQEKFRRVINEYRINWIKDAHSRRSLNKDERRYLWEAVDEDVLNLIDEGEERVQMAAYDFFYSPGTGRPNWQFDDLFEHDFTKYKGRFIWCCYALAWGIQKYDDHKAEQALAETAQPA